MRFSNELFKKSRAEVHTKANNKNGSIAAVAQAFVKHVVLYFKVYLKWLLILFWIW